MKKISAILFLLFVSHGIAFATVSKEEDAKIVNDATQQFMQKYDIPGMYVGVYHAGTSESYYFGEADKSKKTKVTNKTIFEVGSITKVMTALLLAQRLDSAKSQLDDSVTDFVPELPAVFEDMTLKNLATHTSGLPTNLPENIKTNQELDAFFKTVQPSYSADEKWQYSNVGMGLLGIALEKMAKQKIETLYQQNIGTPLHMKMFLMTVPKKYRKWQATGYDVNGAPVNSTVGLMPASGSLKMSAEDMQRFLAASIGLTNTPDSILYPIRMTESAHVRINNKKQGLGWQIQSMDDDNIAELLKPTPNKPYTTPIEVSEMYDIGKFDSHSLIDKTGSTDGFRAYIAVIPDKQAGIVVLANRKMENNEIVALGRDILFQLNGIHAEEKDDEDNSET